MNQAKYYTPDLKDPEEGPTGPLRRLSNAVHVI